MAEQQDGYILLSRRYFQSEWKRDRIFSIEEAWIDLIQEAAFASTVRMIGHEAIPIGRGEFVGSLRFFAQRWKWTVKRVRWYFQKLEQKHRIRAQRRAQGGTVYLLVNYHTYQNPPRTKGTAEGKRGAQQGHSKGTKDNEVNTDNELTTTDVLFETVWLEYPRKAGKQAAKKAWDKLIVRGDPKAVEAGILRYVAYVKALSTEQRYIKHLATLLNSGDWQEDWKIEGVVPIRKPDPDEWWLNERIV